jgi:hypothetical protein
LKREDVGKYSKREYSVHLKRGYLVRGINTITWVKYKKFQKERRAARAAISGGSPSNVKEELSQESDQEAPREAYLAFNLGELVALESDGELENALEEICEIMVTVLSVLGCGS